MFDSTLGSFLRLIISLPIVLALAYFGTKYILGNKYFALNNARRSMKVIDRIQIGPKASVLIVEINDEFYLLGTSEGSVSLLKELEDFKPPEISEMSFENSLANFKFQEILEQKLTKLQQKLKRGDRRR